MAMKNTILLSLVFSVMFVASSPAQTIVTTQPVATPVVIQNPAPATPQVVVVKEPAPAPQVVVVQDQPVSEDNYKEFPLGIMPMLSFSHPGFTDIYRELTVIHSL